MRHVAFIFVLMLFTVVCFAQQSPTDSESQGRTNNSAELEAELQAGIKLTSNGDFAAAIPHLLEARGHVSDEYAANFDLALCYVATGQFNRCNPPFDFLGWWSARRECLQLTGPSLCGR